MKNEMEKAMLDEDEMLEFVRNKNMIKQLTERNEEIIVASGLRQADYGTIMVGPLVVEVSPNTRFDPKLATSLYPLGENGENMELYAAQVDSALAKRHLSPEDYKRCQKVFPNNKVEVKFP
jgi:hypothetical protein